MNKTLVAYFSATGTTAALAVKIAQLLQSECYEIKPLHPYSHEDLNWQDKNSRSSQEMEDATARPKLANGHLDVENYDTIFLGFPIWWYTAPAIIRSFVEQYDLKGKRIILFATSGGSGLGQSAQQLKALCPDANFENGKVFSSFVNDSQLKKWLSQITKTPRSL